MENSIKSTTKDKLEVMQYYANGGESEFIIKAFYDGPWQCWDKPNEPSWDWGTYSYRIKKSPKFRLPTKAEFDNLLDHFSRWDEEKKGLEILNKKGDILFLPAAGYYRYTSSSNVGSTGCYWSSTMDKIGSKDAYILHFDSDYRCTPNHNKNYKLKVRLVSDEPLNGCIEINGLYWKTANEPGYYTFDEAISKFQ